MIQTLSRNDRFWDNSLRKRSNYFCGFFWLGLFVCLFSFKQCNLDYYPLLCELPLTERPCPVWGTISATTSQILHQISHGPNQAFLKLTAAGGCAGSVSLDRAPRQSLLCPWWCFSLFLSGHPSLLSQGKGSCLAGMQWSWRWYLAGAENALRLG